MTRSGRALVVALLVLSTLPHLTAAGAEVPAIRPGEAGRYRFELELIFRDSSALRANRDSIEQAVRAIEALRGSVASSALRLLEYQQLRDRMTLALRRELIYHRLRYSVDRTRSQSLDSLNGLVAQVNERLAFVEAELNSLPDPALERYFSQEPRLAAYRFALQDKRPPRRDSLTTEARRIVSRLAPLTTEWVADHYNQQSQNLKGGPGAGFAESENEVAFGLQHLIRARNILASLRGYPNAAEESYAERGLTLPAIDSLLATLARSSEINRRYERARIGHLKRVTGRDTLDYYKDFLSPPAALASQFPIDDARGQILACMSPLGSEYRVELERLLDPANGRLDIAPGPSRVVGGFATGFPGSTVSMFYMQGYEGTLWNLIVFAHEAGHAVQFELMGRHGVLPPYASGPEYLTESFAQFNELLLLDHLFRNAPNDSLRILYAEQFLNRSLGEIFSQARAVAFENAAYRESKPPRTAGDFNRLMCEVGAHYSIWFDEDSGAMRDWINIPHFSRNPFYRLNYLYGRLLALEYFELYQRQPKQFVPRFLALLANGYTAPPDRLLAEFLRIDSHDPRGLLDASLRVAEKRLAALVALYDRAAARNR